MRLKAVDAMWESLRADPSLIRAPKSHIKELRNRIGAYEADPAGTSVSWEEARDSARSKIAGGDTVSSPSSAGS